MTVNPTIYLKKSLKIQFSSQMFHTIFILDNNMLIEGWIQNPYSHFKTEFLRAFVQRNCISNTP